MKLHTLRHTGTYAFPSWITIDFDTLPTVVAVTGPNGAGKTTLLDCLMAPLVGEFPYRPGALSKQFAGAGVIGLEWSLGEQRYASKLRVDPNSERTEGELITQDTMVAGPLVRDYRKAVQGLVGPPDFLLAAAYAVQSGAGAFLTASRAERKALLSELLGLQRYGLWEAYAKGKVRTAETTLAGIRARVAELQRQAAPLADREAAHARLTTDRATAAAALVECTATLERRQAGLEQARAELAGLDRLAAELREVEQERGAIATQAEDAKKRRAKNLEVLDREAEISAARDRVATIDGELAGIDRELDAALAAQRDDVAVVQAATRERTTAHYAVLGARTDEERLRRQTGLLTTVPCGGTGEYAACAFLKDARAAADALPGVEAALRDAEARYTTMPEPTTPGDRTAALAAQKRPLTEERAKLVSIAELAGPLGAARARVEELDGQLVTLAERDTTASTRVAELRRQTALRTQRHADVVAGERDVADAQRTRREAEVHVGQLERELGQVEGQLATMREAAMLLAGEDAKVGPIAEDLADWTLLVKALGPTGIPALLIDQALPELGRLATELLRECYGEAVFTIALHTQREAAAGDKLLETLDVVVTRGDAPIDAALLSGGEKVLVSEALSLALALYAAGRSRRRIETLLRDEVSAPLDVDRAPAYVRMLRRAAQLGGFRHVLFVTHQPRCAELADAELVVRDGKVTVA